MSSTRLIAGDRSQAHFEVCGCRLLVSAEAPDLLTSAHELLNRFQVAPVREPVYRFEIVRRELAEAEPPAAGLEQVWEGDVPPGVRARNYAAPGLRRLELIDRGWMDLDLNRGEALVTLAPETKPRAVAYFLIPFVCEMLRRNGQSAVHAACLAIESRGEWHSAMIVAESGTGKSTTSLALSRYGWKLMGDDITLLSTVGDRVHAWGLPRECHVRKNTLRLLEWLNDLPLVPTSIEGTHDLPLDALGEGAWPGIPEPLPVAMVICLERPNPDGHRIGPLDRATALMKLSHENVQPVEGVADLAAHGSFATLAELVRQTPVYRLSAGPQLDTLSSTILQLPSWVNHVSKRSA